SPTGVPCEIDIGLILFLLTKNSIAATPFCELFLIYYKLREKNTLTSVKAFSATSINILYPMVRWSVNPLPIRILFPMPIRILFP
ncbi:MAG: hypothetical protein KBF01_03510, partial [Proteocatella sp.]|nr:hypothetical protein [Proteocatella sp.]